jgi:hypothetical protein
MVLMLEDFCRFEAGGPLLPVDGTGEDFPQRSVPANYLILTSFQFR